MVNKENPEIPGKAAELTGRAAELARKAEAELIKATSAAKRKREQLRGETDSLAETLEGFAEELQSVVDDIRSKIEEAVEGTFLEGFLDKLFPGGEVLAETEVTSEVERAAPQYSGAKEALDANPDWVRYAEAAERKFDIPKSATFAIIELESNFDPNAKNPNSPAAGLGQFIPKTWKEFIRSNPKFAGKEPYDPEAAIFATAWYSRKNADECGIDVKASDGVHKLYLAHHEGTKGYQRLMDFRSGKGSIWMSSYYKRKLKTPEAYSDWLDQVARKVDGKARTIDSIFEEEQRRVA